MAQSIVATETNQSGLTANMAINAGTGRKLGFLTWWTLPNAEVDAQTLIDAAKTAGVPQGLIDRIEGRSDKSAWTTATQLGAKGVKAKRLTLDPDNSTIRYITRDVAKDHRAIVREVIDPDQKIASAETVAQVYFSAGSQHVLYLRTSRYQDETEVDAVISGMDAKYQAIKGKVDAARVRSLILDWLSDRHAITVRGSGGVYMIPILPTVGASRKANPVSKQVEDELMALHRWISAAPLNALFSVVEVSDKGATTVDTFVKAAIDELKDDLKEVDEKLKTWDGNAAMNDGSKAYSAQTMLDRVAKLAGKTDYLVQALGDEIGVVQIMMETVRKRAIKMVQESSKAVDDYRATKTTAKVAQPAQEAPQEAQGTTDAPVAVDDTPQGFQDVLTLPDVVPVVAPKVVAKPTAKGKKAGLTANAKVKL